MKPHQDNLALKVDPISPEIAMMLKNRKRKTVPADLINKILIQAEESIDSELKPPEKIVAINHSRNTTRNHSKHKYFAVAASIVAIFSLYITYTTFGNPTTDISKKNITTIAMAWEDPADSGNLFALRERIDLLNSSYAKSSLELDYVQK